MYSRWAKLAFDADKDGDKLANKLFNAIFSCEMTLMYLCEASCEADWEAIQSSQPTSVAYLANSQQPTLDK